VFWNPPHAAKRWKNQQHYGKAFSLQPVNRNLMHPAFIVPRPKKQARIRAENPAKKGGILPPNIR
jgi:hypothetical protein